MSNVPWRGSPVCSRSPKYNHCLASVVSYSNSTILMYNGHLPINATVNPWVLDDDTEQPLHNLLQAVHACIGVELGNPRSNNFILNLHSLKTGSFANFLQLNGTQTSTSRITLIYIMDGPDLIQYSNLTCRSTPPDLQILIQAIYPCQFQKRKSLGPLFVSVLVATLGMFSTGWAAFILIASVLAKQADPAGGTSHFHK